MTDDITFKRDFMTVNGSLPQVLRFVLSHTGMKAGLAERFRALVHIFQNGGQIAQELMETRCDRGAEIARKMRFSEAVAQAFGISTNTGMAAACQTVCAATPFRSTPASPCWRRLSTSSKSPTALTPPGSKSGTEPEPGSSRDWRRRSSGSRRPGFWETLHSVDLRQAIFELEPAQRAPSSMRIISTISPPPSPRSWTQEPLYQRTQRAGHAVHGPDCKTNGAFGEQRRWLKRAALLHDIGKLGVSNSILDKPGKLDPDEWEAMKMHAAHTETILSRIAAFSELASIAAAHHERLDGKGYPRGLHGDQIALETRIITTADIFDALTAERPYRAAMPVDKALALMSDMVGTALDGDCFGALRAAMANVDASLAA